MRDHFQPNLMSELQHGFMEEDFYVKPPDKNRFQPSDFNPSDEEPKLVHVIEPKVEKVKFQPIGELLNNIKADKNKKILKNDSKGDSDSTTDWLKGFSWDAEIDRVNRDVFKNQSFREKQREVINATKSKRDVIALIPTGGGKSLTFQLSAVTEKGVTIVIMPLLSLINDQVMQMEELGVG